MKKLEYSQIVRRKLKKLRLQLNSEFGTEVSRNAIKKITDALFYIIEDNRIIIAEMFDDREDFMYKLFGVKTSIEDVDEYGKE